MLSNEQVNDLFRFCERHYVRYYDVQCELVDHLSSDIQKEMSADPRLSFETALEKVYARFGRMGFAGIVNSHSAALEKQYRRMRWSLFRQFFTFPKIAMTACILIVLWMLPQFFLPARLNLFISMGVLMLIVYQVYIIVQYYRRTPRGRHKLLLLQAGAFQSAVAFSVFFQLALKYLFLERDIRVVEYYVISAIVFLALLAMGAHQKTQVKLFHRAKQYYPQVFA